jgi:hypothetical protein
MNTYVENTAPRISAKAPVMLRNGVRRRRRPGIRSPTGTPVASFTA